MVTVNPLMCILAMLGRGVQPSKKYDKVHAPNLALSSPKARLTCSLRKAVCADVKRSCNTCSRSTAPCTSADEAKLCACHESVLPCTMTGLHCCQTLLSNAFVRSGLDLCCDLLLSAPGQEHMLPQVCADNHCDQLAVCQQPVSHLTCTRPPSL